MFCKIHRTLKSLILESYFYTPGNYIRVWDDGDSEVWDYFLKKWNLDEEMRRV